MYNQAGFIGHLTTIPTLKRLNSGDVFAEVTIAIERDYTDKLGNVPLDYIKLKAFRNKAEFLYKNFKRGQLVLVKGRYQTDSYKDKNGVQRWECYLKVEDMYFTGFSQNDVDNAVADALAVAERENLIEN